MESPYQLVFLAQAFVLALTAVLVVYPLAAYARNVAYTEAFVLLALAFFRVVGVVDFVLGYRTLANSLRPVGALFALAGVYLFARDFVRANDSLETYGDFGDYVEFGGEEGD